MCLVSGISGSTTDSAAERTCAASAGAGSKEGAQSLKKSPALCESANNFSTCARNALSAPHKTLPFLAGLECSFVHLYLMRQTQPTFAKFCRIVGFHMCSLM